MWQWRSRRLSRGGRGGSRAPSRPCWSRAGLPGTARYPDDTACRGPVCDLCTTTATLQDLIAGARAPRQAVPQLHASRSDPDVPSADAALHPDDGGPGLPRSPACRRDTSKPSSPATSSAWTWPGQDGRRAAWPPSTRRPAINLRLPPRPARRVEGPGLRQGGGPGVRPHHAASPASSRRLSSPGSRTTSPSDAGQPGGALPALHGITTTASPSPAPWPSGTATRSGASTAPPPTSTATVMPNYLLQWSDDPVGGGEGLPDMIPRCAGLVPEGPSAVWPGEDSSGITAIIQGSRRDGPGARAWCILAVEKGTSVSGKFLQCPVTAPGCAPAKKKGEPRPAQGGCGGAKGMKATS